MVLSPRIILQLHAEESIVFLSQFMLVTPVERTDVVSVCWTPAKGTGVGSPYTKMWVPVELFSSPEASASFALRPHGETALLTRLRTESLLALHL